jgi:hypothetical protein
MMQNLTLRVLFTGIAQVASFLCNATNRLLIHIAHAPCHGIQFHDDVREA